MSIYVDTQTKRPFIQFELLGRLYKKRLSRDFTPIEAAKIEARWRSQILEGFKTDSVKDMPKTDRYLTGSDPGEVFVVEVEGFYKIGYSHSLITRLREIRTWIPFDLLLVARIPCPEPKDLKRELCEKFEDSRIRDEWFRLSEKDVKFIQSLSESGASLPISHLSSEVDDEK